MTMARRISLPIVLAFVCYHTTWTIPRFYVHVTNLLVFIVQVDAHIQSVVYLSQKTSYKHVCLADGV